MAQPIPLRLPDNGAAANGHLSEHLRDAPLEHAEALISALELLQLLHDRGILDLLRGLVGAGDKVVDTVTAAVDTPESLRAIRNFILLTKFFGSIPPEVLSSLVQTVTDGAAREKANKAPGLLQLLRRIASEDSRHAIAVMLDLLESAGKAL
jgi:uncharacterized protein YjgD (DUF1641 family)